MMELMIVIISDHNGDISYDNKVDNDVDNEWG